MDVGNTPKEVNLTDLHSRILEVKSKFQSLHDRLLFINKGPSTAQADKENLSKASPPDFYKGKVSYVVSDLEWLVEACHRELDKLVYGEPMVPTRQERTADVRPVHPS